MCRTVEALDGVIVGFCVNSEAVMEKVLSKKERKAMRKQLREEARVVVDRVELSRGEAGAVSDLRVTVVDGGEAEPVGERREVEESVVGEVVGDGESQADSVRTGSMVVVEEDDEVDRMEVIRRRVAGKIAKIQELTRMYQGMTSEEGKELRKKLRSVATVVEDGRLAWWRRGRVRRGKRKREWWSW